ncbi:alpha/beta fold hydrolase [Novosphingobium aerophilum]|uniref:alpha/beta fold hydrolase n=1 Tax=Novosphingobium TaxID=165696 RepID=UPI002D79F126|nr:alpha/beta hydrolase [Novosphingobium sp. RL4]WRT94189.1 alpha/beta hydrolase [Novosphingobium sp. RL4]
MRRALSIFLATAFILGAPAAQAEETKLEEFGTDLERFPYPWKVERMDLKVGAESASMAYMDVQPDQPNGQAVVLLHGKNFCGATWEDTARTLLGAGYRVLIPDQLGFCKSSKPASAQYSFAMMADATHRLMEKVGLEKAIILGHSTGGMLGLRFALMYPGAVQRLVLVNPLGLVDRMEEGVPYVPLDKLLAAEKAKGYAEMRQYQLDTYYHGEWKPAYDRWVAMLAGQYATPDNDAAELAQAKTAEMILTQPVSHEFGRLAVPVTLMIGMKDTTVFGKGQAPAEVRAKLKPIPAIAPQAAAAMPSARIVELPDFGHSPQVEAPEVFGAKLLDVLGAPAP